MTRESDELAAAIVALQDAIQGENRAAMVEDCVRLGYLGEGQAATLRHMDTGDSVARAKAAVREATVAYMEKETGR